MKKLLAIALILSLLLCALPALAESYDDALDAAFKAGRVAFTRADFPLPDLATCEIVAPPNEFWQFIGVEAMDEAQMRATLAQAELAVFSYAPDGRSGIGMLAVGEGALPFAGELIQVRDEAREWEGAAERLLHGFALALLVPEAHYKAVAEWVERQHLGARLVYFHVRAAKAAAGVAALHPHSLVYKLAIKPDTPHYEWLEQQLARRFDFACCSDVEQLRREQRAITRAGQIKDKGGRHEKDDRHRIDDRSRYLLG